MQIWKTRQENNINNNTRQKNKNSEIEMRRKTDEIALNKTWTWLRKGNLNRETESL